MNLALVKQWWQGLSLREKKLVIGGAAAIALAFYWLALYRPLQHAVVKMQKQNQSLIADWQWMQRQLPQIQASVANRPQAVSSRQPGVPLLNWLDKQLATARLQDYVKRLEPVDDNRVTLWLEQVPMAPLLRWLNQLQQGQGVLITEFDAVPIAAQPGLGTVRLTIYAP
jgi:general secretion pathway protein M